MIHFSRLLYAHLQTIEELERAFDEVAPVLEKMSPAQCMVTTEKKPNA